MGVVVLVVSMAVSMRRVFIVGFVFFTPGRMLFMAFLIIAGFFNALVVTCILILRRCFFWIGICILLMVIPAVLVFGSHKGSCDLPVETDDMLDQAHMNKYEEIC